MVFQALKIRGRVVVITVPGYCITEISIGVNSNTKADDKI